MIRQLVRKYPEIFKPEKYKKIIDYYNNLDAGDPGVSMEYYVEEIIGVDGYTYDEWIGKHKPTEEEERLCKEYYNDGKPWPGDTPKDYTLVNELREGGYIEWQS